jgi:hypothetical protein
MSRDFPSLESESWWKFAKAYRRPNNGDASGKDKSSTHLVVNDITKSRSCSCDEQIFDDLVTTSSLVTTNGKVNNKANPSIQLMIEHLTISRAFCVHRIFGPGKDPNAIPPGCSRFLDISPRET